MKISISGKGGTGKSMLTTLLSVVLAERGYQVLTVDSDDSNPGLYRMLGYDEAPRPLMDLFGGEKEVVAEIKRRTTGEEKQSRSEWISRDSFKIDDIPTRYTIQNNRQKLISIGKITAAFEGCACPMAEVLKLFLQKLSLGEKEIAIVDMEAGVEHFGRGVEKNIDTVLILVEPTFESISLSSKVYFLARGSGVKNIWAVLNKIPNSTVEDKVIGEMKKRGIEVIGTVHYDPLIAEAALEGKPLAKSMAKAEVEKIVDMLLKEVVTPGKRQ